MSYFHALLPLLPILHRLLFRPIIGGGKLRHFVRSDFTRIRPCNECPFLCLKDRLPQSNLLHDIHHAVHVTLPLCILHCLPKVHQSRCHILADVHKGRELHHVCRDQSHEHLVVLSGQVGHRLRGRPRHAQFSTRLTFPHSGAAHLDGRRRPRVHVRRNPFPFRVPAAGEEA